MKAATLPLFSLAPIEVTPEMVAMAAGKTPPFEGMTPGKPVQIFPKGEARTVDGRKVCCEAEDFQLMLGDLATRKNPVTATVEHEMDPTWGSRAAGECSEFIAQGDGFWGLDPHWTEPALADIRSGARRWISPTFYGTEDETGRIRPRILRDYTLCSVPNLDGMQPVTASASRGEPGSGRPHTPAPVGSTPTPGTTPQPNSPSKASERKEQETMKLSADTLKLLGLADGASLEDIDKAVIKLAAEKPDVKAEVKAVVREEMAAEREAIRAEVRTEMAAEHAKKARETRIADLVKRADDEGKVNEDNKAQIQEMAAAAPDSFEKLVLPGLPVVAAVKTWFKAGRTEPGVDPEGPESSSDVDRKAREFQKAQMAAGKPMTYTEAAIAVSTRKVA